MCGCKEGRHTAFSSGSIKQYPGIKPPSATQSTPPPLAAPGKEEGSHVVSDKQQHEVMASASHPPSACLLGNGKAAQHWPEARECRAAGFNHPSWVHRVPWDLDLLSCVF